MSKTFKDAFAEDDTAMVWASVPQASNHFFVSTKEDGDDTSVALLKSDAPALALAILEAAGITDTSTGGRITDDRVAVSSLKLHVKKQERATAEAREQAELEAEALELWKAFQSSRVDGVHISVPTFATLPEGDKVIWLAVARRAREMRAEK